MYSLKSCLNWGKTRHLTNSPSVVDWISTILSGLIYLTLLAFIQPARADAEQPKLVSFNRAENVHPHFHDGDISALNAYAHQIRSEQAKLVSIGGSKSAHPHFHDPGLAALRDYAQHIGIDESNSVSVPRLRLAEADSAFEALRELLRRREQPSNSVPQSTPGVTPGLPRPAAPGHDRPVIHANHLGTQACLFCHANQAKSFGRSLRGRIRSTRQNAN